ncbi:MAG: hypothetical protein PW735_08525 [Acidobacteriaceae bacterium]|nr:hypothetical protein [Acidobacteriaceae bacterium]
MQRLCPRCRYAVTFEDEGSLIYCTHCGAPQVRLSDALLEQMDADRASISQDEDREASSSSRPAPPPVPGAVSWPSAVRAAAITGLVALLFALLSLAVPVASALGIFWALGAPAVAMAIYSSRARDTQIHAGFGARLGVLTGMAIMLAMTVVNSTSMVITRYVFHNTALADAQFDQLFAQARASMLASGNAAEMMPFVHTLDIPEFRAGILLASLGVTGLIYLGFTAIQGAIAGALRTRRTAL